MKVVNTQEDNKTNAMHQVHILPDNEEKPWELRGDDAVNTLLVVLAENK